MRFALELNRYACSRLNNVDICYPSFVDPSDVNSHVISFDGRKLILEMEPYSFIRLNKDNQLFFGVVDKELKPIDHTTRKVGVCEAKTMCVLNEYNRVMLGRLFGTTNPFYHSFLTEARTEYGKFYTGYVNPQILFIDKNESADDYAMIHHEGYSYLLGHNIVYVPTDKIKEIRELHNRICAEYNFGIELQFLYLDTLLETFG